MHTLKIAGASYEGVKVVHFLDESGNTCDYVDADEIFKGDFTVTAPLATDKEIDILTKSGESLLVTKNF